MEKFNIIFRIKTKILRKIFFYLKHRPDSYPFISGDGFRKIANFIYDEITTFQPQKVERGNIIFVASPLIDKYFKYIHPQIKNPYKLITHNGDNEVGEKETKYIDNKIIHWFAQNNTFKHYKITPIPIGIENRKWFMSGYILYKKYKKIKKENIDKKQRILFGFNSNTNIEERSKALTELKENPLADEIKEKLNPDKYFKLLNQYNFVVSPPGNGVDCHRTWEALYLDIVPLVKRSYCMEYFKEIGFNLKIVDNYKETNLLSEKKNKNDKILHMDYWIKLIKNY